MTLAVTVRHMMISTGSLDLIHRHRLSAATALLITLALMLAGCGDRVASSEPAGAIEDTHTAATSDDPEFNRTFSHEFAEVDGVRMHYVTGGSGPPLVLLHGWPQTWFEWRGIMPELAKRYTVYALDLPGLGDSRGAPPSYDKATLARFVHGLVSERLGLDDIRLVAHDLGAGVGFQYAAQYPGEVRRYAHLDYPLPGPALSAKKYRTFSWHLSFHDQPDIPETLIGDEVRAYLSAFYPQVAFGGAAFGGTRTSSPFSPAEIDEYARTYRRPQVLSGGFELYRTLDEDERDNKAIAPTDVPTLLMTAEGGVPATKPTLAPLFTDLRRAVEVPGSGHWLPEENASFVTRQLLRFLDGGR